MLVPAEGLAPVPPEQVTIYLEQGEVPAACQRIALITTSCSASGTSVAATYEAARKRAGAIGANALLIQQLDEPSTARQIANVIVPIGADRKGQMTAYSCPPG